MAENGPGAQPMAENGLIHRRSRYGAGETMTRLQDAVKTKGLTVFAAIDHAAGAAAAGLPMRPTVVLIFGNARGGTPLMQLNQTIGIDLPLKALVWEDANGAAWLSYNDPRWLAARHGLGAEGKAPTDTIAALLDGLAESVTSSAGSG